MMDIPTFDDIFKPIKINFWLTGIPFDSPQISLRFYVLVSCIFITIVCEVAFFISKIAPENILQLTQLAPCCCIGILATLKMILLAINKDKIFQLTNSLDHLYKEILDDVSKTSLVKQEFIFLKRLTKSFYILNALLISVYNFSTLIIILYRYVHTNKVIFILPYAVLMPFPVDSWLSWLVVYLQSITSGFICVLYFTTVDSLYYVMTTHISSHFALLSHQIIGLDRGCGNLLNDIIKRHQNILRLSGHLEDIFNAPNLFNVLVGSLEICALGFSLTIGDWTEVPGVVLFLFSVLLQIFMMSYFGENIIIESRKIGVAAFMCNWYNMDQQSKRIILQLMQRSSKPQRLTAYKFSTISYESFVKIISTSWSYFTILKTVYKPAKVNYSE